MYLAFSILFTIEICGHKPLETEFQSNYIPNQGM